MALPTEPAGRFCGAPGRRRFPHGNGGYSLPGDGAPFYGLAITEAGGRWGAAAKITATSCARDGYCAINGFYETKTGTSAAMVATRP